jgi:hypothetical protein
VCRDETHNVCDIGELGSLLLVKGKVGVVRTCG